MPHLRFQSRVAKSVASPRHLIASKTARRAATLLRKAGRRRLAEEKVIDTALTDRQAERSEKEQGIWPDLIETVPPAIRAVPDAELAKVVGAPRVKYARVQTRAQSQS